MVQRLCGVFSLTYYDRLDCSSEQPGHRFAYQCLNNVKLYAYAKLVQFKCYEHFY